MYPAIEVAEARKKAWDLRVKIKRLVVPRKSPSNVTLNQLFLLYEDCHSTSDFWGREKAKYFRYIPALAFSPWNNTVYKKLQRYLVGGHAPLRQMQHATRAINKVVAWGEENGIIQPCGRPLVAPRGRSLVRRRYQPPSDGISERN